MKSPLVRFGPKGRTLIRVSLVILITAVIVCYRLAEDIGVDLKPDDRWIIVTVIDGDTVELAGGDKLRLANIDTPEIDEPFFEEAKQFLTDIALHQSARVEYIRERRDKYGRLLGCLFIDSVFAGEAILERGLGYLLLFDNNDLNRPLVQRLLAAQHRAMESGLGLFSLVRTPEEHYLATYRSFRFHRPGCEYVGEYRPDRYRMFDTRDSALFEGLSPCRSCKP
ncbi:MAG: thermonuclease family protein [candidate division Zixibacteria bacterium]|nr:thermonuclease family protein [candidate division Zixibacteria bacterium]MDH3937227.1 thermonuclease family protein [candidate division Zixibacteria bacterium]MDH4034079.1 thermonuclease family protein [candidate division Zixibacteria bacterium]